MSSVLERFMPLPDVLADIPPVATSATSATAEAQAPDASAPGVSLDALHAATGTDWPEIQDRPEAVRALARLLAIEAQRQRGERPEHYRRPVLCRSCGPVWLWESAPPVLLACPWCLTDHHGARVPRPLVCCATCDRFIPSETEPAAGLGRCRGNAPATQTGPALWAHAVRTCPSWCPPDGCAPDFPEQRM
jgi:hypothetical protein